MKSIHCKCKDFNNKIFSNKIGYAHLNKRRNEHIVYLAVKWFLDKIITETEFLIKKIWKKQ